MNSTPIQISDYRPTIGLEIHAQLLCRSKIFSGDSAEFGSEPNTNISVVSLGHPGTLPKLNARVVEMAVKIGLACQSEVSKEIYFDRKNYFYPDLPKGYQITQDQAPICQGGSICIETSEGMERKIRLRKIHLEEDAGKSIHPEEASKTLVDFNRAGVPLVEIVTEPDIHSPEEAGLLMAEVRKLVRYLEVCDGNMEQGSMRCDANVSVAPSDSLNLGSKVEIKNMNSIKNLQKAVTYEIERQIKLLNGNQEILSETRTFHEPTGTTISMREKEDLNDYRYFPDPDLSPVMLTEARLNQIRQSMPALPWEMKNKFIKEYGLPAYDAGFLTETKEMAFYFEELRRLSSNSKAASNWIMGPIKSYLNDQAVSIEDFALKPVTIAELIALVEENRVSFTVASQNLFPELLKNPGKGAYQLAHDRNLIQDSDKNSIQPLIEEVLASYPEKVQEYKKGKKGLIGLFVGEVMKKSKGKANPKLANELLIKSLSEQRNLQE